MTKLANNLRLWPRPIALAIVCLAIFALGPIPAFGLEADVATSTSDPRFDPSKKEKTASGFYPELDLRLIQDDNIYRVENNQESDTVLRVEPSLLYILLTGKHRFTAAYEGILGYYQEHEEENTIDSKALVEGRLDLSHLIDINASFRYTDGHEERGTEGTRDDLSDEPDLFNESHGSLDVIVGRSRGLFKLVVLLDVFRREYTNNDQEGRTRNWTVAALNLYYNVSKRFIVFVEGKSSLIDYTEAPGSALDSTEYYLLAGARWRATAKTQGVLQVGYVNKNLDDERLEDFNGLAAIGWFLWEPKSYSRVLIRLERVTQETPQIGTSFYVHNRFLLAGELEITRRLLLAASANLRKDVFSNDREDDHSGLGVSLTHDTLRWLNLTAQYNYSSRTSTQENLDFVANSFMFKISINDI